MMIGGRNFRSLIRFNNVLVQLVSIRSFTSSPTLEETVKAAVEAKAYVQIPDILVSSKRSAQNPSPFSFLSTFPQDRRTQVVDEILQSLIPLRPRSRSQLVYSCLLSHILQSCNPLPLGLAILQCIIRSGCIPVQQNHLHLSSAWLDCRASKPIPDILLEMQSIGYRPDCGTCNYLISSLCAVDQLGEAVNVLKGMSGAGCVPDLESYGTVIDAMCRVRKTTDAVELLKQMVVRIGLTPRQGTVLKVAAALRANREIWKCVEIVEFLVREGYPVGFESYLLVVKGCLECKDYILAAKVVMGMTGRGFIPYIGIRQKVVEGLTGIGEWKLACTVRQRFMELKS